MNSAKRFSVTPGKTDGAENQARAPCLHIIMETEADVVDRLGYLYTFLEGLTSLGGLEMET